MNEVFRHYLRKFTLVFFDDILICSICLADHVSHLTKVLTIMRHHNLFSKRSKHVFGTTDVEYMGHVISAEGVATNSSKIELKKCSGDIPAHQQQVLMPYYNDVRMLIVLPVAVLDKKIVKKNNVVEVYGLIKWANGNEEDAT
ncbi:hypothetical protein Tco_1001874 [Tanacetum coccineum]